MSQKMKSYRESDLIKYNYQAIYQGMLEPVDGYQDLYELLTDLEVHLKEELKSIDHIRYPEGDNIFHWEIEPDGLLIPENAVDAPSISNSDAFLLAIITSYYPLNPSEKPSGIIFGDYSFLQIDVTVVQNINTNQVFLLFYSIHYGRIREGKEIYHFRYDMESDYQYNDSEVHFLDYKPRVHFHGNSDDPHFNEQTKDFKEKLRDVISILKLNLTRLQSKYNECDSIFPITYP